MIRELWAEGAIPAQEVWLASTAPDREGDAPSGLPGQILCHVSSTEHALFKTKSAFLTEKPY